MTPLFIIYLITNKLNTKKYVGQTTMTIEERWKRHCWRCTLKTKRQIISSAILKYGKENFQIFEIDYANSLEEANRKEVYWGLFYNALCPNGYNLKLGGRCYSATSNETRAKIGLANKGKKASPETIKRLSESHKGFKVADGTKEKLSILNKGKKSHHNTNKAASSKVCKKYVFISPEGKEVVIINMRKFCLENNLGIPSMSYLATGKKKIYKGWRCKEVLGRMNKELGSRRFPLLEDLALGAPVK